jgi:hypothetical protein
MEKLQFALNLLSAPILLLVLMQLIKISRALIRHEIRHALIADYLIQLCRKAGIRCKEDAV